MCEQARNTTCLFWRERILHRGISAKKRRKKKRRRKKIRMRKESKYCFLKIPIRKIDAENIQKTQAKERKKRKREKRSKERSKEKEVKIPSDFRQQSRSWCAENVVNFVDLIELVCTRKQRIQTAIISEDQAGRRRRK